MAFSEETIQQVWEKATPVAGNDPAVWRQDQCKAWMEEGSTEIEIVNMVGK